jgi:hypothetical protein
MTSTDPRAMQAYLDRPLDDLLDELSVYDTERGIGDTWAKIAGPVYQRLCVEWDWCQVRQDARFENDLDLAMVVVGLLSAHVLMLPFGVDVTLIAAIVVKRGLDWFCGCPV